MKKARPRIDILYVRLDKEEEITKTKSGLYLPPDKKLDQRQAGKSTGVIVAISDQLKTECNTDLKEGDHVLFQRYTGVAADINEEDENSYIAIRSDDILLVLDETTDGES